jgi:hypothetical protein
MFHLTGMDFLNIISPSSPAVKEIAVDKAGTGGYNFKGMT